MSAARRWQLASCWHKVQTACQLGASYGVQRDRNYWVHDQDIREGGPYPPSPSAIITQRPVGSMESSDFHLLPDLRFSQCCPWDLGLLGCDTIMLGEWFPTSEET